MISPDEYDEPLMAYEDDDFQPKEKEKKKVKYAGEELEMSKVPVAQSAQFLLPQRKSFQDSLQNISQDHTPRARQMQDERGMDFKKLFSKISQMNKEEVFLNKDKRLESGLYILGICVYNCLENMLNFVMFLNCMIYPNIFSTVYFFIGLVLTFKSLIRDEKKVRSKQVLVSFCCVMGIVVILVKVIVLVKFALDKQISISIQENIILQSFGIFIDLSSSQSVSTYDVIMTLVFDLVVIVVSVGLTFLYQHQEREILESKQNSLFDIKLLNPIFPLQKNKIAFITLVALLLNVIFVQSLLQLALMIFLMVILNNLVSETDEANQLRCFNTNCNIAKIFLILQLVFIFFAQIPLINEIVSQSLDGTKVFFSMLGLLIDTMPFYARGVYLTTTCFAIQGIQVYKVAKKHYQKSLALQSNTQQVEQDSLWLKKNLDGVSVLKRKSTLVKSSLVVPKEHQRSIATPSLVLRERSGGGMNQELQKWTDQQEDMEYKITLLDFLPYILFWICRVLGFFWCFLYHDFQSIIILLWILHSSLFQNLERFLMITINFYLPAFCLIFLFYYLINIPFIVSLFAPLSTEPSDLWYDLGFYQFSIPWLEISFMILSLVPFFFIIKAWKTIDSKKVYNYEVFLTELASESSPTYYYLFFAILNYMDKAVFIVIFFTGVNEIDFYHITLMVFIILYSVWPDFFKKYYIVLLVYVEFFVFKQYFFSLMVHYMDPDGFFTGLITFIGLLDDKNNSSHPKYFRYSPNIQQWVLILSVYFQYIIHKLMSNDRLIDQNFRNIKASLKQRFPRSFQLVDLLSHLYKELFIMFVFIVCFAIIIFADKNIINWGFQFILGIFLIAYLGVGNYAPPYTGLRRLSFIWNVLIYYSAFVLIAIILFQFGAITELFLRLEVENLIEFFPDIIRLNPKILGFELYSDNIQGKFLPYVLYFIIGVWVKKQFQIWKIELIKHQYFKDSGSHDEANSDMESYSHGKKSVDWQIEYLKHRFTAAFFVYKLRAFWNIFDKLSSILFVIISFIIMFLSNYWQISVAMLFYLACFISLCMAIGKRFYQIRKVERAKYKCEQYEGMQNSKFRRYLTVEEINEHWKIYKKEINEKQILLRQKIWFAQFIFTILCICMIYPTEYIYTFREQFPQYQSFYDNLIFYLFWCGIYHSPKAISGHGYFASIYGYLIIIFLLLFEKIAQKWALNRFGCNDDKALFFNEMELNLRRIKRMRCSVIDEKPEEEEEDVEGDKDQEQVDLEEEQKRFIRRIKTLKVLGMDQPVKAVKDRKTSPQNIHRFSKLDPKPIIPGLEVESSVRSEEGQDPNQFREWEAQDLQEELVKLVRKKYKMKVLNGIKVFIEDLIQLMLLVSAVYKDNIFSLFLLLAIFFYSCQRNKISSLVRVAYVVGFIMIFQYALALSNLNYLNNPMTFPHPFLPEYPRNYNTTSTYIIPWFVNVDFLEQSRDWCLYLGIGLSNVKLNGIWLDYITMGVIQSYFFYFNCQLFSWKYRIQRGERLQKMFEDYCIKVQGNASQQVQHKENLKLKKSILMYTFYKGIQKNLYMYFHSFTIIVTLLLTILSTCLSSLGYIVACLYMIYQHPKFFKNDTRSFKMKELLKYFLKPYVFADITLQIIFQIPLATLHASQFQKHGWQNVIGFYQIWNLSDKDQDEVIPGNISYILLKAVTYFLVSLQIQIFRSKTYKKFTSRELKQYMNQADTKGLCIAQRFNNYKILKIVRQQQERQRMESLLDELKKKLLKWHRLFFDNQDEEKANYSLLKSSTKRSSLDSKVFEYDKEGNYNQDYLKKLTARATVVQSDKGHGRGGSMYQRQKDKKKMLQEIQEEESGGLQEDPEEFKKLKAELSLLAKLYLFLKKNVTQQILFITKIKKLSKVQEDMVVGRTDIDTKLEIKIMKDLKDIKESKEYQMNQIYLNDELMFEGLDKVKGAEETPKQPIVGSKIRIKDMKRTSQYIDFWNLLKLYIELVFELMISYSQYWCYFFMIMSMMRNSGIISLFYPFATFGYAIMEETTPSKGFWQLILVYTEFIILTKFVYCLSFWDMILAPESIQSIETLFDSWHTGLDRLTDSPFNDIFTYYSPEIMMLFCLMIHIQKEILLGLYDYKEYQIESIRQAIARYLMVTNRRNQGVLSQTSLKTKEDNRFTLGKEKHRQELQDYLNFQNINIQGEKAQLTTMMQIQYPPEDLLIEEDLSLFFASFEFKQKIEKSIQKREGRIKRGRSLAVTEDQMGRFPFQFSDQDWYWQEDKVGPRHRAYSLYNPDEWESYLAKNQDEELIFKQKQSEQTKINAIQNLFYKNKLFERLFPSVKEQKPGVDLYSMVFSIQFLICMFLIFQYTKMSADVTNATDAITYNQFSGEMVSALFLQILVMILDRFLYKSKTFISIEEMNSANDKTSKMQTSRFMKSDSQNFGQNQDRIKALDASYDYDKKIQQQKFVFSVLQHRNTQVARPEIEMHELTPKREQSISSSLISEFEHTMKNQMLLESTKITFTIVSKFYMQLIMLIIVHWVVFWYFPIQGNLKLQGSKYCDRKQMQAGIKQCNEFWSNNSLIFFYILYCLYFLVSALQIKYGLPEIRKGNFMMGSYTRLNCYMFRGFMAIPFLFELKTFSDWTFTKTSLDVFQWFILSNAHAELFIAKCMQGNYRRHKIGNPIPKFMKIIVGIMGIFCIIFMIAGPLLLFSTLNPISEINPVLNSGVEVNIVLSQAGTEAENTINLYQNKHVSELREIPEEMYEAMEFEKYLRTKSFDLNLIQYVKVNNISDSKWEASQPNRDFLRDELYRTRYVYLDTDSQTNYSDPINGSFIKIQLYFQFDRKNPTGAQRARNSVEKLLTKKESAQVIEDFYKALSMDCKNNPKAYHTINIKDFFIPAIILSEKDTADIIELPPHETMIGLNLRYSCEDFWVVNQVVPQTANQAKIPDSHLTGVAFFTFSYKISPSYFKYSVLTFYISIVFVIGRVIRNVAVVKTNRLFIYEIPYPDQLLMLCECIYIYRMQNKLMKEEELFFTLMDIMRSTEMIKTITGGSLKKKVE